MQHQAERFIELLTGLPNTAVTFQTFREAPGSTISPRIGHGSHKESIVRLRASNEAGGGVFVMINAGDLQGRRAENVLSIRALFVDLDGAPIAPVLEHSVVPHIVVESSKGRYHAYWRIADCPLERFALMQAKLAAHFGGDPSVIDRPRVMRLPGYKHNKDASAPFETKIIKELRGEPYTLSELEASLNGADSLLEVSMKASAPRPQPLPDATSPGQRNNLLTSVAGALRRNGADETELLDRLAHENAQRCSPPLPDDEVAQIAHSVARYAPAPTFDSVAQMIEADDGSPDCAQRIAPIAQDSAIPTAQQKALLKLLKRKTGVPIGDLRELAPPKPPKPEKAAKPTHLDLALEVLEGFGEGNIVRAEGMLWVWDNGGTWKVADDYTINKIVMHTIPNDKAATWTKVRSVSNQVAHVVPPLPDGVIFDAPSQTVVCENGELDYKDGLWHFGPHRRESYRRASLPVAFDPMAKAPRFEQFLGEIFQGDIDAEEKRAVILEALGYTLLPSCEMERFFLLIGNGANGKSVVMNVLARLIGHNAIVAVQPSQFENQFQRAHLQGKLANVVTEMAEGAEIADAQLKSLVSGEKTTAERKYCPPFEFHPIAKHWFGTNHMPHSRDFSDALFRRAVIVQFNRTFRGPDIDTKLIDKLTAELPGIFNMALEALTRLLTTGEFTKHSSGEEAKRTWRVEADQAAQFVEEECELAPGSRIVSAELYARYRIWAEGAGITRMLNRNNFSNRMKMLGLELSRGTGGGRMISGVKLRTTYSLGPLRAV